MKKEQQNFLKKIYGNKEKRGWYSAYTNSAYVIAKLVNENLRCGLNLIIHFPDIKKQKKMSRVEIKFPIKLYNFYKLK